MLFVGQSWTEGATVTADTAGGSYAAWMSDLSGQEIFAEGQGGAEFAVFLTASSGETWSAPVDVIAHGGWPEVLVDKNGMVHLFWSDEGCINHSSVPWEKASDTQAWQETQQICVGSGSGSFDVAQDTQGGFHVAWNPDDQTTVYYARSEDLDGRVWSEPFIVAQGNQDTPYVGDTRLAVDEQGTIHVVWTDYCAETPYFCGVSYSQSTDGGMSWSNETRLAESHNAQPSIVARDGALHVAWNTTVDLSKRMYRKSGDAGLTWEPTRVALEVRPGGILGAPGLAVDSAGIVHIAGAGDQGLYYTCGVDESWQPQRILTSGSPTGDASLALVRGNELLLTFREGVKSIWLARGHLTDIAREPAMPFGVPTVGLETSPAPSVQVPPTPSPTMTPFLTPTSTVPQPSASKGQVSPIIWGVVPVVALIAFVILRRLSTRRR